MPLPEVLDADGDGLPDLLFRSPEDGLDGASIALQTAPGRFAAPSEVATSDPSGTGDGDRVWIGPVDGRPGAEIRRRPIAWTTTSGLRLELEQAREPRYRVRLHPMDRDRSQEGPTLRTAAAPSASFEVKGWVTSGDSRAATTARARASSSPAASRTSTATAAPTW